MRRMGQRAGAGPVEVETRLMAGIVASTAIIPPQFMIFVVELPPSRTTAQSTGQEVMVDKLLPVSPGGKGGGEEDGFLV